MMIEVRSCIHKRAKRQSKGRSPAHYERVRIEKYESLSLFLLLLQDSEEPPGTIGIQ